MPLLDDVWDHLFLALDRYHADPYVTAGLVHGWCPPFSTSAADRAAMLTSGYSALCGCEGGGQRRGGDSRRTPHARTLATVAGIAPYASAALALTGRSAYAPRAYTHTHIHTYIHAHTHRASH
jgi:hypothetical protein